MPDHHIPEDCLTLHRAGESVRVQPDPERLRALVALCMRLAREDLAARKPVEPVPASRQAQK